jgi:hypothetical protein
VGLNPPDPWREFPGDFSSIPLFTLLTFKGFLETFILCVIYVTYMTHETS